MTRHWGMQGVAAAALLLLPRAAMAINPSLCLRVDEGCPVRGGALTARVLLGPSSLAIVSAQYTIDYDANSLELLSIEPGAACDGASPFSAEVFESVDVGSGRVQHAVSVPPGGTGAMNGAVLACLGFRVLNGVPSDLCLINGGNPFETKLSSAFGTPVLINNAGACPTMEPLPAISCDDAIISQNCVCNGIPADCSPVERECIIGFCVNGPAHCEQFFNDGGSCDDGNACTGPDKCDEGWCIGGNCPNPSLCINNSTDCHVPGSLARMEVVLGSGAVPISGGQFRIQYDPAALEFAGISPGSGCSAGSPFTTEVDETVDTTLGIIDYAVGTDVGTGATTSGPAVMACLSFIVRGTSPADVCIVEGANPFETILAGPSGEPIAVDNAVDCHPHRLPPYLACRAVAPSTTCNCPGGAPDCSPQTDDCNLGVCVDSPARCDSTAVNDGGACHDGYACTAGDTCHAGTCLGVDCGDPSLCLEPGTDCAVPGSAYRMVVRMGAGTTPVVSGEFHLVYDVSALRLVSIDPGRTCDPTSPFALEVYESHEPGSREIHYAVGVDLDTPTGTTGPAVLACLTFEVLGERDGEVCMVVGENPQYTRLGDGQGNVVGVYNALACPAGSFPPNLACHTAQVGDACTCPAGSADCSLLTTDCGIGECATSPARCIYTPAADGTSCDDGEECTTTDLCAAGECIGSGCTSPSLCVIADDGCQVGELTLARVVIGQGSPYIVGGEFSIQFNPAVVEFVSIQPGRACDPTSPFELEIYEDVEPATGELFYAAGVAPGNDADGTQGPATLACLTVRLLAFDIFGSELCLFIGDNPTNTVLVDRKGRAVYVDNTEDCANVLIEPLLACEPTCKPVPATSTWTLIEGGLLLLCLARIRSMRSPER